MSYPETDKNGRAYLKLKEAKAGMKVEVDDGFTCTFATKNVLEADQDGDLFFLCDEGEHYIRGHADDGVHCIGIYPI